MSKCDECGKPKARIETFGQGVETCLHCSERAAREHEAEVRRQHVEGVNQWLSNIGVPFRYWPACLAHFTAGIVPDLRASLYLHGGPGRGKTHLAVAILKEHYFKSKPGSVPYARFVSVTRFLRQLRSTWLRTSTESEDQMIDRLAGVSMLVLDDLGVECQSDHVRGTIYTIVDERYGSGKQTIVTSNLSLRELAEQLHDRMSSRITEMVKGPAGVVEFTGPDRRVMVDGKALAAGSD
jgi:DNA replication protein DnaC